jgi:hypothetical protein
MLFFYAFTWWGISMPPRVGKCNVRKKIEWSEGKASKLP